jgi:transposase
MTYSLDLRKRVVSFVEKGGTRKAASDRFQVHYDTVRGWLKRSDLMPKKHGQRHRKIDKVALAKHVEEYPNMLLRERAVHFGVYPNAIGYALKTMKIVKKTAHDIPKDVIWKELDI